MPPTRLALVSQFLARASLVVLGLATIFLVMLALGMPELPEYGPAHGDLDTYARVVTSLRGGMPYYPALHTELLQDGYGTLSVFNWRPPVFLSFVALFPTPAWTQTIIVILSLIAAGFALRLTEKEASLTAVPALALLLAMSLAACVAPRAGLVCELMAGALILLSISAYGLQRSWLGFAAAVAALFTREIAGLYIVVCVIAAWREGRRRELVGWAAVLVVYALYYAWHAYNVLALLGPQDHADPVGWLRFGGAQFVLLTAAFDGIFLMFPYWVMAALLPVAVLGLAAWPGRGLNRALWTVLGYMLLFAFVGKPNNSYWGALYTPLLSFGLVWAPAALRDLVRAAMPRPALA